jgi:hypothetical protein
VSLFTFESSLGFGAERTLGGVEEEFFEQQIDFHCSNSTRFLKELVRTAFIQQFSALKFTTDSEKLTTSLKLYENRSRHFPNFPLSSP